MLFVHSSLSPFFFFSASTLENKATHTECMSQKERELFCFYIKDVLKVSKKICAGYSIPKLKAVRLYLDLFLKPMQMF